MNGKKVLKVVVVVLVLILMGLCFYAGTMVGVKNTKDDNATKEVDKNEKKDNEEKKEDKKEEPEKKEEEKKPKVDKLSLTNDLVLDANSTIPRTMCHGYDIKLTKQNRTVKDLSAEEKLAIVTYYFGRDLNFDDVSDEDYTGVVTKTLDKKVFSKLFEDVSFLDKLSKIKDKSYWIDPYGLTLMGKEYEVSLIATGCTSEEYSDDYLKLVAARREDDSLILTYMYAYVKVQLTEDYDDFNSYYYVNKGDKKYAYKDLDTDKIKDDVLAKFNKYEFVYDISKGNLRLQEINYIEAK